jgi:hypothetical protein
VTKELVSRIDYVSDDRAKDMIQLRGKDLKVQRIVQASGETSASKTPTKFTDERMGGGVFRVDGSTPHVEVVAGKNDKADVRFFQDTGQDWKMRTLMGTQPTWADVKATGVDQTKFRLENTAKHAPAPRGKVVMYGPYNLPAV